MLTKKAANFYFFIFNIFLLTGCNADKSTDHVLQYHELQVDALPSFVPVIPDKAYLFKSIKYAKVDIVAKEDIEKVLFFNGCTFYDFKLWVMEGDSISHHLHYGNTVKNFPNDKSKGIFMTLSFRAGKKKTFYDLGFTYNDTFSIKKIRHPIENTTKGCTISFINAQISQKQTNVS
ncbi:hypothetical protein [Flammeovirga aprica]|uniref:Lipoprotein n=1 Tax=Flammeovirga aprica JL-4 TaxID=694437 RepID=A0A7X9P1L2_9BACT|nr:hypothetical protein [Flammeovirga aprica]NME67838.1 hypothetical protein [Flammeovirga aprica JL-4]